MSRVKWPLLVLQEAPAQTHHLPPGGATGTETGSEPSLTRLPTSSGQGLGEDQGPSHGAGAPGTGEHLLNLC